MASDSETDKLLKAHQHCSFDRCYIGDGKCPHLKIRLEQPPLSAAVERAERAEAEQAEEYRKRCVWVRRAEDRGARLDALIEAVEDHLDEFNVAHNAPVRLALASARGEK